MLRQNGEVQTKALRGRDFSQFSIIDDRAYSRLREMMLAGSCSTRKVSFSSSSGMRR